MKPAPIPGGLLSEDPQKEDLERRVHTLKNSTFRRLRLPLQGKSTHFSLRFKSRGTGRARIGKIIIHFDFSTQE